MLSREELEKQRATQAYRKLHEAGKTDEARRDMARLAIIRQQREEAAKKREVERKCVCVREREKELYNYQRSCFSVREEEAAKKEKGKSKS